MNSLVPSAPLHVCSLELADLPVTQIVFFDVSSIAFSISLSSELKLVLEVKASISTTHSSCPQSWRRDLRVQQLHYSINIKCNQIKCSEFIIIIMKYEFYDDRSGESLEQTLKRGLLSSFSLSTFK